MIAPSSNKVWFWFPCLVLLCLIGCLIDSIFFWTSGVVNKGDTYLQLAQSRGAIVAMLRHETQNPRRGPLVCFGERVSNDKFGLPPFSLTFFPVIDSPGPDHPTSVKTLRISVPHPFLIAVFLAAWLGTRRWWQRRKARLQHLHAAPPP